MNSLPSVILANTRINDRIWSTEDYILKLKMKKPSLLKAILPGNGSAGYIFVPVAVEMILAVLIFVQSRTAAMNYLYALVVMLFVTAAWGTYEYNRGGDMKLFAAIASLCAFGVGVQLVIDEVYPVRTTFSALKYAVSAAVAGCFLLFYSLFRKILDRPWTIWLMIAASVILFAVLKIWGIDPNGYGTYAWIKIKSYTVQLTDFTKVFAVLFYSSLFSSRAKHDEKQVLIISSIYLAVNLIGCLLVRELGSFFILFFLHLSVLFIFLPKGKVKRTYLLAIAGITVSALAAAYILYKILYPKAQAGELSGVLRLIWPYVRKIYQRFSITANIQNDPYGAGYQLLQGKKVLWISGLYGNTVNFNAIPVPESDMAFIALVNAFGLPAGLLAVLMFMRIMLSGSELALRLLRISVQDGVVVYGATVLLVVQALLVIFGSCNLIPLAGLPIPFLSRGFTYQTIVFCFSGLLMMLSRQEGGESNVTA